MVETFKKYSKSELLQALTEKCPDALANFPPPEVFEFRTHNRNGEDNIAVKIGFSVIKRTKRMKGEIWLEEYQTFDHLKQERLPPGQQRFQIGNAGPCMGYDPIFRPAYGAEAKDEYQRQEKYIGLYYTNADNVCENGSICNAGSIKGNESFENFSGSDSGILTPYASYVKAVFRFILLHCGHATHYEEFKDAKGKVQGLGPLIKALKNHAHNMASEGHVVEPPVTQHGEKSDDETAIFVPDDGGKKRSHDGDDEAAVPKKKFRQA